MPFDRRVVGSNFESFSIRHVGILGKSLTRNCLWRFGLKLRHSIRAVSTHLKPIFSSKHRATYFLATPLTLSDLNFFLRPDLDIGLRNSLKQLLSDIHSAVHKYQVTLFWFCSTSSQPCIDMVDYEFLLHRA